MFMSEIFSDKQKCGDQLTIESFLSGVHYYRCYDYVELMATVQLLPDFLRENPKVILFKGIKLTLT